MSEYGPGHVASQIQHHNWRTADNSLGYLLPTLRSLTASKPDLELLDVGAGPGTITASLAGYMPRGHITATDISDDILDRARQHAEDVGVHGNPGVTFCNASVLDLPFPDASFDVTHAHQVLLHLDNPVAAAREMVRVTRPGGVVALGEADVLSWSIYPDAEDGGIGPILRRLPEIIVATMRAFGAHPEAGRRLAAWAIEAGVARDAVTYTCGAHSYCQRDEKDMWASTMADRLRRGRMRAKALEMGIASEDEMDKVAEAWEDWSRMDDSMLAFVVGEMIVRKP